MVHRNVLTQVLGMLKKLGGQNGCIVCLKYTVFSTSPSHCAHHRLTLSCNLQLRPLCYRPDHVQIPQVLPPHLKCNALCGSCIFVIHRMFHNANPWNKVSAEPRMEQKPTMTKERRKKKKAYVMASFNAKPTITKRYFVYGEEKNDK